MAGRTVKKVQSPYSSRGQSPSSKNKSGMRKSRSADDQTIFKPPSSRGSESGSDGLDQSVRKAAIRNTSVPDVDDNINVCVRVRPLSSKETKSNDVSVIDFPGNGQLMVAATGSQKPKVFSYNVVFQPGSTQEDVLQFSGVKRLIEMAVEGFSCTAFCYGQTGSGKTHTLTGPPGLFNGQTDIYSQDHGLVFRSFMYLFKLLQERSDFHFVLKASFLEIYNEKVIDLLNPGLARKPLAVRWSKKSGGFFVENLFTVDCEELDDLLAVLEEGMKSRAVGRHNMNEHSSRSHTLLTVHITSEQQIKESGVFITKQGKINFVDLAGSEMTKKTHSEGKTLEEANNINKSLMVLGYCIASLSDSKKKGGHIPYRDSKLTKLLADSLAGNGVTLMIACISPAKSNITETLNTLRYAARAKKIRTKPIVVMDPREALILSLKREVGALHNENEHLRTLLRLADAGETTGLIPQGAGEVSKASVAAPPIDMDKLSELSGPELFDLLKHYMGENDALRRENSELFSTRDILIRDQELVCRENERLLKKLEDVNSVCCRSPIIPARPTFSAEMLNASVNGDLDGTWANGSLVSLSSGGSRFNGMESRLPEAIQKELNKRQIGKSVGNISELSSRRSNSGGSDSQSKKKFEKVKSAETVAVDSANILRATAAETNYVSTSLPDTFREDTSPDSSSNVPLHVSTADPNQPVVDHDSIFGSVVSLRDENSQ